MLHSTLLPIDALHYYVKPICGLYFNDHAEYVLCAHGV